MTSCPKCGNPVSEGAAFCGKCGCALSASTPTELFQNKKSPPNSNTNNNSWGCLGIIIFIIGICLFLGGLGAFRGCSFEDGEIKYELPVTVYVEFEMRPR